MKAISLAEIPNLILNQQATSSKIINNTQFSYYQHIIKSIKDLKNTIWKSRNTEKNLEQSERIKYYVHRRYTDFKDNTS